VLLGETNRSYLITEKNNVESDLIAENHIKRSRGRTPMTPMGAEGDGRC
jgi:hypothetical protein